MVWFVGLVLSMVQWRIDNSPYPRRQIATLLEGLRRPFPECASSSAWSLQVAHLVPPRPDPYETSQFILGTSQGAPVFHQRARCPSLGSPKNGPMRYSQFCSKSTERPFRRTLGN